MSTGHPSAASRQVSSASEGMGSATTSAISLLFILKTSGQVAAQSPQLTQALSSTFAFIGLILCMTKVSVSFPRITEGYAGVFMFTMLLLVTLLGNARFMFLFYVCLSSGRGFLWDSAYWPSPGARGGVAQLSKMDWPCRGYRIPWPMQVFWWQYVPYTHEGNVSPRKVRSYRALAHGGAFFFQT